MDLKLNEFYSELQHSPIQIQIRIRIQTDKEEDEKENEKEKEERLNERELPSNLSQSH